MTPSIDERVMRKESKKGVDLLWRLFPRAIHTFQYIKKTAGKSSAPVKTHETPEAAWADGLRYNSKGYDVYFMVNEGDGVAHEGKQTCRSQDSVIQLSACFIDTDNCDQDKVDAYLQEIGVAPHLQVESSPGRFHYYFLLEPTLARPENVSMWQAIQHMLHRLGNEKIKNPSKEIGMDSTMHDYAKVLRVPGFTHVAKIHTVKVVDESEHEPYSLEQLYALTEGSLWDSREEEETYSRPVSSPAVPWEVDPDAPLLGEGERFQRLQTLSLSLANDVRDGRMTEEEARDGYEHFVLNGLLNDDETYAADYQLTEKSWALWRSALRKVEREKTANIQAISASLDKKEESPWNLPDEFYLSAPGGFGDVVKQVMGYSLYPCAALAFGTFLAGLSILKAKKVLTPQGSSPALYIINVAVTGWGKGDPMTLLQNMFENNGMRSLISNEIRSDRGIYEHLKANEGTGLFLLDEVAPLFRAIQKEDAHSHQANICKALLQLFSAGAMKGISFGKVAVQKGKSPPEIVIDNPMLAVCAYTVPEDFDNLFNAASVAKGLFQRFIPIVADIEYAPKNPDADKHAIVKSDLFQPYYLPPQQIDDEGEPIEPLIQEPRRRCRYTKKALATFNEMEDGYRRKLVATAKDPEQRESSGLYSRLAEQIERIATVLAPGDEIDLATLEYAAKFVESRHRATLAVAGRTLMKGKGSDGMQAENRILAAIGRICTEDERPEATKREVYTRCRKNFANMREFDAALQSLTEMGKITVEHRKHSRKGAKHQSWIRLEVEI